jgi:L,D-peptidoglycan transpeptidase YkuD (ErfK/YbiS/YcfS/YnhG family)
MMVWGGFALKWKVLIFVMVMALFSNKSMATEDQLGILLQRIVDENGSRQVVLVTTKSDQAITAKVSAYAFENGGLKMVFSFPGVVGKNGISKDKIEGDMKSPAGIFKVGDAFTSAGDFQNTALNLKQVTHEDYWVDDVTSTEYNQWVRFSGDPNKRWKSFERIKVPSYKYGFVIEYNQNPVISGLGSAIFFHLWDNDSTGTAGCTAVSEGNLLKLLKWLDQKKNPVIIQGTEGMTDTLIKEAEYQVLYPVRIQINQKEIMPLVAPRIRNGRTLVPLRSVFEELGAKVYWDGEERSILVVKGETKVKLWIDKREAVVNGETIPMDEPPRIINDRTLVPVRLVMQSLGAKVSWDGDLRMVLIEE